METNTNEADFDFEDSQRELQKPDTYLTQTTRSGKVYYLHNGTEPEGPFSMAELVAKKVSGDTYLWCDGMFDWAEAKSFGAIRDALRIPAVPPPFNKKVA